MVLKDHAETMSLDGVSNGVNFAAIDGEAARQVWYLTVMPNLLLSMHPDYVMTRGERSVPGAPAERQGESDSVLHRDEHPAVDVHRVAHAG
jgi:Rieske 2Fe-2S family protein